MRGHAKIELTNIKTGETEVVEHSNMFTNALQEIMKPVGNRLFTTVSETTAHYCKYLTGLVCLGKPIEENPEIVLPPAGNDIIAYGTNYAYTGSNIMCGSFNVVESTKENDQLLSPDADIKLVWDFAGNQGNGTISCLSLTSQMAPMYSMFGSKTAKPDVSTSKPMNVTSYDKGYCGDSIFYESTDKYRLIYADYNSNCMYFTEKENFISTSKLTGKLCFRKFKTSLSSVLLRNPNRMQNKNDLLLDYVYIDIPREILDTFTDGHNDMVVSICSNKGYIYCYLKSYTANYTYIEVDEVMKILKINIDDWSTQIINVKNTTGEKSMELRGYLQNNFSSSNPHVIITNKCLLLSTSSGIHLIDINNNADVTKLKDPEDTGNLVGGMGAPSIIENKIYFYSDNHPNLMLIDTESKKTYYTELHTRLFENNNYSNQIFAMEGAPLCFIICGRNGYGFYTVYLAKIPFYIATINNLDVPVVKTPAQTMKITYTLTSKAEELPEQE